MKTIGLVGSPRKGGNTDLLVSTVLYGSGAAGSEVEKLFVYDFDIAPCVDCRGCKKEPFHCIVKDDMRQLYPKLEAADVIVFGTPLYWYGPTAKMKLLIDKLRPYIASKKMKRKKAILIIPSEEGPEACSNLVRMFEQSFSYLGLEIAGKILATASEKGEVQRQPKVLDEAFQLGKSLS
jgi:multimeric flavodoxin WrbA